MPEEERFGNSSSLGQLAGCRAREPFAREQRHRRIDNGLAAFVAIEACGSHDAPESKRSLTWGQETGLRQNRHTKLGGHPPKPAQSAVWQWPSPPISGRDARHTQEGRSGISPRGATAKSPINRAIHDNRHLRPLSPDRKSTRLN